MPAANASGEVFSLSGDGHFEGPAALRGGAAGRLSVAVALEAEACHGLSLEASASAFADVSGILSFYLAGRATGFGVAQAGANAIAQLRPDAFDRMGLILDVAAYAEASAGGRLAIALDFDAIATAARSELDGVALEIFLAFSREIVLEAGVWGRVGVAAMAVAYEDITLTLKGENPGFAIEAGAALGAGAGTGWDFYGSASFTDLDRFVDTAIRSITRETVRVARENVPPELSGGVEALSLVLPIALRTTFKLGQKAALDTLAPPEEMVGPFLDAFVASLRDYLLDKIVAAARNGLQSGLEYLGDTVFGQSYTDAQIKFISDGLRDLAAFLQSLGDAPPSLDAILEIGGRTLDIAAVVFPEETELWSRPFATLWCAIACAEVVADPVATAALTVSVIGVGQVARPDCTVDDLPQPPALVRDAMTAELGRPVNVVRFADAIDYFIATGVLPLLGARAPLAGVFLDELAETFGLDAGEMIEAALRASLGGDVATLDAYQRLRDFLKDKLDGVVRFEVIPSLIATLGAQGRQYITDVAQPSLDALSTFVFERLDALVSGVASNEQSPFLHKLSAGCSDVIYRIVARNVVFLENILFEHILDGLSGAFRILADRARSDSNNVIVRTLQTLLPTQAPLIPFIPSRDIAALRTLVGKLAEIGAEAFGPRIWTLARRERWRRLKRDVVLGRDRPDAFQDRNAVEAFVSDLILCSYVPNQGALEGSVGFVGEVLADSAGVLLPRAAEAFGEFLLAISQEVIHDLNRGVHEFLDDLGRAVEAAFRQVEHWLREIADAIAAAEQAARDFADAIDELGALLRDPGRRPSIRDALYAAGAATIERDVRNAGGDDVAVSLAIGTYWLAFQLAVPLIDLALDAAAGVTDSLANVINGAVDAADALQKLIAKLVKNAKDAVRNGAAALGVTLPNVLSAADVANAIADALPTNLLEVWLDEAIRASQAGKAADAARRNAQTQRDRARAEYRQRRQAHRDALPAGRIGIEIWEPVTLPSLADRAFMYGPHVPALVRVRGATRAFFVRGRSRRVRIALNGQVVHFEEQDWHAVGGAVFEWHRPFALGKSALVAGLNVLEVSVVDGVKTVKRTISAFVVDPGAPMLTDQLAVDDKESTFDPRGAERSQLESERVVISWAGSRLLPLADWIVQDRHGVHRYRFGDIGVGPRSTLTLVTAGDPLRDREGIANWGLAAPVWNNAGDVVCVIDDRRVLRCVHTYLPSA